MFGHDWEHGTAKVINRELLSSGGGETPGQHRYVVDVQNPTGEPFRGEIQDPGFRSSSYVIVHVGDEVAVLVDYGRQQVKLDKHDPSRHTDPRAFEKAVDAKFKADLSAPAGTPSAGAGSGIPTITINGKVFKGPIDKAELQKRLSEAGKSAEQG
jgi:hypothetical protein